MSAQAAPVPETEPWSDTETASGPSGPRRGLGFWAVRIALGLIVLVWTIPTVGLLVSSFRPERAVRDSGWWTQITTPLEWTLENYVTVLEGGMATAFVNSIAVAV